MEYRLRFPGFVTVYLWTSHRAGCMTRVGFKERYVSRLDAARLLHDARKNGDVERLNER